MWPSWPSPRPRPTVALTRCRRTTPPAAPSRARTGSTITGPQRTCIGCRRKAPQSELVRFVRGSDGSPVEGRTLPGRGAWLCQATLDACQSLALRRRAFARAFRDPGLHTGRH
ncbi:DUF448 domain-containing protein [Mumia sp.]|uniref:YlxR family protein n=1 Tax=Mumia sp. TaxID=1965300 RepID=UPI00344EB41C